MNGTVLSELSDRMIKERIKLAAGGGLIFTAASTAICLT